jgi:hypothetical protein
MSRSSGRTGIVNLFVRLPSSGREVGELHVTRPLGGDDRARHVLPDLESLRHFSAILCGGKPVASRSAVLGDGTIRGEKPLGVPWRFAPLHPPLPLARRLVGVFGAVVEKRCWRCSTLGNTSCCAAP